MESKAALAPERVQEFVRVAHGGFERVQELLAHEPALLNAAWDWGGGDWETALGAASHMGRRDIALFLLGKGARLDIFAAAMLGHLPLVKAVIEAQPEAKMSLGPHGIPLLVHAQMGGEQAADVLNYLQLQARFLAVHPIGNTDPRALPVASIETALPFYTEKLGFAVRSQESGSATLFRDDLEIVLAETGADPEQASCVWNVSDIESVYAEYKVQGLNVSEAISPMEHDGKTYRVFFLKDNDGLCYCLSQPAVSE